MIIKWHLLLIRSTALAGEINRLQGRGALQADVFLLNPSFLQRSAALNNSSNALRNSSLFIPANAEDRPYL